MLGNWATKVYGVNRARISKLVVNLTLALYKLVPQTASIFHGLIRRQIFHQKMSFRQGKCVLKEVRSYDLL